MASKQVTDREKSTRAVVAAAETHAGAVGSNLARQLAPFLQKGEAMPDLALLIQLLGRQLHAATAALKAADTAHETELADDAAPRNRRDAAAEAIRATLVDLRAAIENAHGAAGLKALGIDVAVPEDPSVLATMAERAAKALSDKELKLVAPRRRGVKVDREEFARELHAELPALQKALRDVAREEREAEATQAAKWTALATNDRVFSQGAALLSAAAIAAGLDEIAARVRPSGRRPGRTASGDETPGESEGGPGTGTATG